MIQQEQKTHNILTILHTWFLTAYLAKHLSNLLKIAFLIWEALPFVIVYKLLTNNKELTHHEALSQLNSFYSTSVLWVFYPAIVSITWLLYINRITITWWARWKQVNVSMMQCGQVMAFDASIFVKKDEGMLLFYFKDME